MPPATLPEKVITSVTVTYLGQCLSASPFRVKLIVHDEEWTSVLNDKCKAEFSLPIDYKDKSAKVSVVAVDGCNGGSKVFSVKGEPVKLDLSRKETCVQADGTTCECAICAKACGK